MEALCGCAVTPAGYMSTNQSLEPRTVTKYKPRSGAHRTVPDQP
jgi:hypothetical protein